MLLVVDDEPTIREVMSLTLEADGYRCVCASGAREALEVVEKRGREIQCMITDLHMPEMDGIELIRKIRESGTKMDVVVSTGYIGDDEREALAELGVTTTLAKPYTCAELLTQVRSAKGIHHAKVAA
jgi:CheY-like chemotaxis protein